MIPNVVIFARKYVLPNSVDDFPWLRRVGSAAAAGSRVVKRGSLCERCVKDGKGRDWGKAGTASRWLSRGGIKVFVVVGGARSNGAVSNRVIGWRWGCFFFGSYLSASINNIKTYTSSDKLLNSDSQILNPSPPHDNLDDLRQDFRPVRF